MRQRSPPRCPAPARQKPSWEQLRPWRRAPEPWRRRPPRPIARAGLLSRRGKHTRAIADAGFDNSPPYPSAAADHDHGLSCERGHVALLASFAAPDALTCKTRAAARTHRRPRNFFAPPATRRGCRDGVLRRAWRPYTNPFMRFASEFDPQAYAQPRRRRPSRARRCDPSGEGGCRADCTGAGLDVPTQIAIEPRRPA